MAQDFVNSHGWFRWFTLFNNVSIALETQFAIVTQLFARLFFVSSTFGLLNFRCLGLATSTPCGPLQVAWPVAGLVPGLRVPRSQAAEVGGAGHLLFGSRMWDADEVAEPWAEKGGLRSPICLGGPPKFLGIGCISWEQTWCFAASGKTWPFESTAPKPESSTCKPRIDVWFLMIIAILILIL